MTNATSQSQVPSTSPMHQHDRVRMETWDEFSGCVCCGSRIEVVRVARFGHVPFCRSCLDCSLHPGIWDDLGEAGD